MPGRTWSAAGDKIAAGGDSANDDPLQSLAARDDLAAWMRSSVRAGAAGRGARASSRPRAAANLGCLLPDHVRRIVRRPKPPLAWACPSRRSTRPRATFKSCWRRRSASWKGPRRERQPARLLKSWSACWPTSSARRRSSRSKTIWLSCEACRRQLDKLTEFRSQPLSFTVSVHTPAAARLAAVRRRPRAAGQLLQTGSASSRTRDRPARKSCSRSRPIRNLAARPPSRLRRFLRRQFWTWPLIAAALLGGAGWWVNRSVETAMRQQRINELEHRPGCRRGRSPRLDGQSARHGRDWSPRTRRCGC